jgi:hypothetical protein
MNLVELQKKLTGAARLQPDDERVPYAFEKRILTLLATRVVVDSGALWARGLWRAALSCVIVVMLVGAFSLLSPPASENNQNLSQDFENTLLASVDQGANAIP